MPESATSPRRLAAKEKQRRALELRRAGASYAQIGRVLGYRSTASAHKAVEVALTMTLREPAEAVRQLELERLDEAQRAIWPRVRAGDLEAIDRLCKLMDRRAKLLGLDAPKQVEVLTIDTVDAELRRLEAEMTLRHSLPPA